MSGAPPSAPRAPGLAPEIAKATEDFTGRGWALAALDQWLADGGSRVFLITGGPGTGKTALAARLAQISAGEVSAPPGARLEPGCLSFCYFCQARSDVLLHPLRFIEALSGFLARRHPRVAEALVKLRDRDISVSLNVGAMATGARAAALEIKSLQVGGLSARTAFDRLVRRPLQWLYTADHGEPIVILIDALDEAWAFDPEENLVTLLRDALDDPQDLPPKVRFVLTSRPDPRVLSALGSLGGAVGLRRLDLIEDAPDSLGDVRAYALRRLAAVAEPDRGALAERVARAGEGNFLYARFVLDDLLPRIERGEAWADLPLPRGLPDVYREFLGRELGRSEERWEERYRPVLGALALARGEGLSAAQLSGITELKPSRIADTLRALGQYLAGAQAGGPFRLYHQSFRDFLLNDETYGIYAPEVEDAIGSFFAAEHEGRWLECEDEYALRYTPAHLALAAECAEQRSTQRKLRGAVAAICADVGWMEAKAARLGVDEVVSDLRLASRLLAAEDGRGAGVEAALGTLEREAHALRLWEQARRPAFFAQQVHNRAVDLGQAELARAWAARLSSLRRPYLELGWRAASEAPALRRVLEGHAGWVRGLRVTPGGGRVVSVAADRTLRVWDLGSGKLLRCLGGGAAEKLAVSITPDGRRAITLADEGGLRIWDLETGAATEAGAGVEDTITAVVAAPDGRRAVVGCEDGALAVIDLETGAVARRLEGHRQPVEAAAMTRDGRLLSASMDGTLKVWDLEQGREVLTLSERGGPLLSVAVTPDGRRAVTGGCDQRLLVWDLGGGSLEHALSGHGAEVGAVAVTDDGRFAVSASDDRTLKVWDLAEGRLISTFIGHEQAVRALAITPDGGGVLSGSDDWSIRLWDLAPRDHARGREGHAGRVRALRVTPAGDRLVSGSEDRTLKVWDLAAGAALHVLGGHGAAVRAIAVTPGGRAVSASADATLKVWDLATGREEHTLTGHAERVVAVAPAADGRRAVSCSDDATLKVWDLATGKELANLDGPRGHTGPAVAVALSPDGRRALSASYDARLKLWDLESGEELATLRGHADRVFQVRLTPDGRRAISGSWDRTIKIWDLETGKILGSLEGHGDRLRALALTPDGRRAVSGAADGSVMLWDLEALRPLSALVGHSDVVYAVDIDPGGRWAISGSEDRQLLAWDLAQRSELAAIRLEGGITCVTFAPDGRTIVAGDGIGNVYCLHLAIA